MPSFADLNSPAPAELGPVMLAFEFYRETPAGRSHGDRWDVRVEAKGDRYAKPGPSQPDLTNLIKGAEDALAGIVFGNDAQVCEIRAARFYGPQDGVRITAYALEPAAPQGQADDLHRSALNRAACPRLALTGPSPATL